MRSDLLWLFAAFAVLLAHGWHSRSIASEEQWKLTLLDSRFHVEDFWVRYPEFEETVFSPPMFPDKLLSAERSGTEYEPPIEVSLVYGDVLSNEWVKDGRLSDLGKSIYDRRQDVYWRKIYIFRVSDCRDGWPTLIIADMKALIEEGDSSQDVQLRESDIVYVRRYIAGSWGYTFEDYAVAKIVELFDGCSRVDPSIIWGQPF